MSSSPAKNTGYLKEYDKIENDQRREVGQKSSQSRTQQKGGEKEKEERVYYSAKLIKVLLIFRPDI